LTERQIAAETKRMASAYRKLPRDVQIATLANLHEMALKFAVGHAEPEISQPRPTGAGRRMIADPPGMPVRPTNGAWDAMRGSSLARQKPFKVFVSHAYKDLPHVLQSANFYHIPHPDSAAAK
jgi:hypothetical protein